MGLAATKTRTATRSARREVPKSRGGRPTKSAALERDQRLIEVATRLFLDRGFDATSLDAVAEAARVSKPTVYSRYGDKRGLFTAVLRREIDRWLAPLSAAAETQLGSSSDVSVEQRLVEVGREMLTFTCGPDAVAFSRMMTSQAINFPDIAKLGKEEGWLKAVATTARFFDHLVAQGALDLDDTTIAAEVFLDVVVGHTHRMATFGMALEFKSAEKRMRAAIKLFLAGALGPADRVQTAGASRRRTSR
ncbi:MULTISPECIES: TetR/AcrR family transcriptional regulator [Bradyrhizobium]|uniref:TetR family transcriptional regulator n=1 Tax=Bradyrhizobium neotropicale TaxID=1497615 RepID=A0A176YWT6_9BRAD|nr:MULTISPECIES: TetR/AcrR family transcriptional regulator [Bradyrhizobium]OAF12190.1 TetR family transcriptional regulator [Bradyrhizobium neotropicale]